VDRGRLEPVAASRPQAPPGDERRFDPRCNGHGDFDLDAWIRERGVPVKREGSWEKTGYRWILEACSWNGHTDNAAYIVRLPSGGIAAGCHHNSCQGMGWREMREHFEPGVYKRNGRPKGDHNSGEAGAAWEAPASLPDGLPPVATFDPEMLPGPLRAWVLDIAERMQVPLD
jgi:hypothetical protein